MYAQEFEFEQQASSIPATINGQSCIAPWTGGMSGSDPEFCDIDADSDVDLFISDGIGYIWYLENLGEPASYSYTLVTQEYIDESLYTSPYIAPGIELCDLDNDSDKDMFINTFNGIIHYWQNQGNQYLPNFVLVTDTLDGILSSPGRFDFCDIDCDGDYDLFICATVFGYIRFYRNDGTPEQWDFNLIDDHFLGISTMGDSYPEFIDIDNDNDFDLFVGEFNGRVHFYCNDGDSINYNFTYVTDYYSGIDVGTVSAPEFVDIDGDNDYDLFVGCSFTGGSISIGDVYFYRNVGSPDSAQFELVTSNFIGIDEGYGAHNRLTDIDANGTEDLFIVNSGDYLSYYDNDGSPDAPAFTFITQTFQDLYVRGFNPFFVDIDADNDQDLFAGSSRIPSPPPPGLYFFINRGTPQSADFQLYSDDLVPGDFYVAIAPALADVDNDSDYDLLISDDLDGDYFFYENIGSPEVFDFEYQTTNWQGISTEENGASCFYDIDNDNDLDLFMTPGIGNNQVWFYRNTGTSQSPLMVLETQQFLHFEQSFFLYGIHISDIDNDGDGDFFLGTGLGGILFFRNTTGDTSAVTPRLSLDPRHGIQLTIGPNPANPITWISYNLPYPQKAEIAVYNLLGQKVVTLASGLQMPGQRTVIWDAADHASGQYFIRMETDLGITSDRVVVVK